MRYGAFLRTIRVGRRFGDYAHATAHIGTAILRQQEDMAQGGVGPKAHVAAVRAWLTKEALKLPGEECWGQAKSLPDALDLLGMCLAGGLPLPDSLNHVRREIAFAHPDLATRWAFFSRAKCDSRPPRRLPHRGRPRGRGGGVVIVPPGDKFFGSGSE